MKKRSCADFGVLLVDKPRGPSSGELVQWVRWALGTSSVGHCGTLDPDASGLMVLLVGKATRLSSRLSADHKGYQALFALGQRTDTDDGQGRVLEEAPVTNTMLEAARALVHQRWEGSYELLPPRYSAVRVDGQRAHRAARAGKDLELAPRTMQILSSTALDAGAQETLVRAHGHQPSTLSQAIGAELWVSKGSYIRSFALELGRRVGVPAHLAILRRNRCGAARLEDPRVVRGLRAEPFAPAKNGAPRWRIRWGEPDEDKGSQAARIRQALVEPWELLPIPSHEASSSDEGAARLGRAFFSGQPVPITDASLPALGDLSGFVWLDRAGHRAALLRRDPATAQQVERWAPELVLSWPPADFLRKPTPKSVTNA